MHDSVEAGHAVIRAAVRATLGELLGTDITMAQLKALAVIDDRQACTMGMLSERLGVKPPAASLLVDKLVRAGLAFRLRDAGDARRVLVRPTIAGTNLIGRVRHGGRTVLERWVRELSDQDLAATHRAFAALAAVAGREQVEQPVAAR